jgi:ribosomal protein S12 methylthiotransferase
MLGHLERAGHVLVDDPAGAEVVVVNTCGFIDAAREESVETILDAARLKREGRCRRLVVAGCMVQRYHRELASEIPEIDAFVGLDELGRISGRVAPDGAATGPELPTFRRDPEVATPWIGGPSRRLYDAATPRTLSGPPWSAYLKVAEGCDQQCSFCAIPTFRGAFRSRRLGDLQDEARRLAASGVRELNLISQDTTSFGRDLGLEEGPALLLEALAEIEELRWIRLFYLYPNRVTGRLVETMARLSRVVEYVDIPLQHAHPDVLRRMRRGGSDASHLRLLERFRQAMPDVAIRSTFIVGFPGETDHEFEALLDFVAESHLDVASVFAYSHEEGTHAGGGPDDVPPELKEERRGRLLAAQEAVSLERNLERVGRTFEVLCEGPCEDDGGRSQGRLRGQAPEVDGRVVVEGEGATAGDFVPVTITEASPLELVGRVSP